MIWKTLKHKCFILPFYDIESLRKRCTIRRFQRHRDMPPCSAQAFKIPPGVGMTGQSAIPTRNIVISTSAALVEMTKNDLALIKSAEHFENG